MGTMLFFVVMATVMKTSILTESTAVTMKRNDANSEDDNDNEDGPDEGEDDDGDVEHNRRIRRRLHYD